MVMENNIGQMEQGMKESGGRIKHMEEESFGMLMVMYSMESGLMTKLMATEFIHMSMELSMKDIGKTICNMVME